MSIANIINEIDVKLYNNPIDKLSFVEAKIKFWYRHDVVKLFKYWDLDHLTWVVNQNFYQDKILTKMEFIWEIKSLIASINTSLSSMNLWFIQIWISEFSRITDLYFQHQVTNLEFNPYY